ncbi:sialic acid-binding Ig-like lectin 16 isoform X1 [Stegastes partitus]|uniref:Sialic acid-binding Ig-like lectin 16 isoform X1 n=1 Tax=Stegastes partitus TaxID=144197 RepID=A0A9Y4JN90_9TELE|nr:PREDICTED: sialic acid-binding Ig-like lectin 16 isoform X1 [Stegastes partitus]
MTLIYLVIFWFFLKTSRCQLQCVQETFDDTEFSINVTEHIQLESSSCHEIPYKLTFLTNNVTAPYEVIWFEGDPANTVAVAVISEVESETQDSFEIYGLPQGEYEYGLKLEWGCNQTYIFPKRVHISVSELTQKPDIWVPHMVEGEDVTITCIAERLCYGEEGIHWKWTKADGVTTVIHDDDHFSFHWRNTNALHLSPTADDHNSNLTCVVEHTHDVVETTVTLNVQYSPKILNSSECRTEGKLLVCTCISQGNPLPPITWPLDTLTDYSVSSFSSIQTVTSTIILPAADYHNATVKCSSSNEVGLSAIEIPVPNGTENLRLDPGVDLNHEYDAVFPWIIVGVSLSLNLVLLTTLIICIRKGRKSSPKELCEEMNTYASLNVADVEQPYGNISLSNQRK